MCIIFLKFHGDVITCYVCPTNIYKTQTILGIFVEKHEQFICQLIIVADLFFCRSNSYSSTATRNMHETTSSHVDQILYLSKRRSVIKAFTLD